MPNPPLKELTPSRIAELRAQFPALSRTFNDRPVAFFDGPAGTQVPQRVVDAISDYLLNHNANHAGLFATSQESDQLVDAARRAFADFVGADDPDEISFGQNMTSLTFAFSRALARTWKEGDEIILTRLDHDANVTPWVLAARDAGVTVRYVDFDPSSFQLDLDQLQTYLNPRTQLVAVGAASNASGGINPVSKIVEMAHEVGAKVYVDAVHLAPHRLLDVQAFGCDFLICSAYKFFGPHTGILWGKRKWMESLEPYKVRPAPDTIPDRWMTGTQSFECIVGSLAAIEYMASIASDPEASFRERLCQSFAAIEQYEQKLSDRLLEGFAAIPGLNVFGSDQPGRADERVATFSITLDAMETRELAQRLCDRGHFVWHGHYYALQFSECLGNEPGGMVRIGALHYNTVEEVDRLLRDLHVLASDQIA